ncbi:MAG TPA: aminopeptidase N [Nocardioides sp.]
MPSLTLTESRTRAADLAVTAYDVHLDLTSPDEFTSSTTVHFTSRTAQTFIELANAESVQAMLNGATLAAEAYADGRLALSDLQERNELVVTARLPYVTNGDGMHTFTDPADGERYVSAYCGMDIASTVFACFDQPDLKAPITLSVDAEEHWTVLANGVATSSEAGRWSFTSTPPISTYLFVVCAGPWHSVTSTHKGLPFGWHARRSLADDLDRQAPELEAITRDCFDHYTQAFAEPYPFDSYEQVFVPGQNWGALETPGCVTFRDEFLFRGEPSAMQRQARAMVIAHEMAHMWFGDLVTMKWWEDSWLNESFADYMGYQVAATAAGYVDSWIACAQTRKPQGLRADALRSTHPIAEDAEAMVDVDTAFGNFDMITDAKGNAVLRQLVAWLGEEPFLAGVNAHLGRHRFGNADLADFLDALDGATDRDVRAWAESWLRSTGFDTIRVERRDGVPILRRDGSRPHRFTVNGYAADGQLVGTELVDLAGEPVALPAFRGLAVVPNAGDETFAPVQLDVVSQELVEQQVGRIADPLVRAVLWRGLVEMTRSGRTSVEDFLKLVARHLPIEEHPMVFEGAINAAQVFVVNQLLDPARLDEAHEVLSATCTLARHRHPVVATRVLTSTTTDTELLHGWLECGATDLGAALDQEQRWAVVRRLVELGGDPSMIATEEERDQSAAGRLAGLRCRAAVPTTEAKKDAWAQMFDGEPANRDFTAISDGFWTCGQHDLVADYLPRLVAEAPGLAERRGQAFSKVVGHSFPHIPWPLETLTGFRAALAAVLDAGDLPTVLAREWNDHLDELDLTLAARTRNS